MRFLPFRVGLHDEHLEQLVNDMLAQIRAQRARSSPTVNVMETANGTTYEVKVVGGGGPAAGDQEYTLQSVFGNYLLATDGTRIAKHPRCRNSVVSEMMYGNPWAMSYPHNNDNGGVGNPANTTWLQYIYRKAAFAGLTENQGYVPPYIFHETIIAAPCKVTGVVTVAADTGATPGTPISFIEKTPRMWARFADQTFGT